VIHLKVSQESPEFRFRENPARVGPGAARNIFETARAIQTRRNDSNMGDYGLGGRAAFTKLESCSANTRLWAKRSQRLSMSR
jgi:hypothetical protein